jgi:hypothetical protein
MSQAEQGAETTERRIYSSLRYLFNDNSLAAFLKESPKVKSDSIDDLTIAILEQPPLEGAENRMPFIGYSGGGADYKSDISLSWHGPERYMESAAVVEKATTILFRAMGCAGLAGCLPQRVEIRNNVLGEPEPDLHTYIAQGQDVTEQALAVITNLQ